jgi:hypothetical protein
VAVSWSDEEDHLIRYEKGTRRYWRLGYDQADSIENVPLTTVWEQDLFDMGYLCDVLLKTCQQFHKKHISDSNLRGDAEIASCLPSTYTLPEIAMDPLRFVMDEYAFKRDFLVHASRVESGGRTR